MNHKWVVRGFYFYNETDYNLAKKDQEKYLYIMDQLGHNKNNKEVLIEVYNKLYAADKFKTVVGMSYMKDLYEYILRHGYATEEELRPLEGFTLSKIHSSSSYSYVQMDKMKMQMNAAFKEKLSKYKSTVNTMKLTIIVLCALVATLFYFGINKNNASNYASAKETIIDEYTSWEEELTKKEQELKQREEEIKKIESDLEIHN